MKFIYIKILVCIFFLMAGSGCSIDDIEPNNLLTEDNAIRDDASAQAVLDRAYVFMRSGSGNGPFPLNMESFTAFSLSGDQFNLLTDIGVEDFDTNNVQEDNATLSAVYAHQYAIINTVNFLIEALEGGKAKDISEARQSELLSEAKALRAIAHFDLLKMFGQFYDPGSVFGIVLRTSPARDGSAVGRNTVQEAYDAIINDLEFAIENGSNNIPHYRISATTSRAYLAKVQLYMGDYANAATNALTVIGNNDNYALDADYGNIFFTRWESPEVLFAPFAGNGVDEGDAGFFISLVYSPAFAIPPSPAFRSLADDQDGVSGDGDVDFNASGYDPRFVFAYSFETPGKWNPAGITKYPFAPGADNGNTIYFMRMAEIYLIFAEAEARRSGGNLDEALSKLNDVRNRATGIVPKTLSDQATLLEDIRGEKTLELFAETGESWFDLVRYDILGDLDATTLKPTLTTDKKFIFPIPRKAMASNILLVPNP